MNSILVLFLVIADIVVLVLFFRWDAEMSKRKEIEEQHRKDEVQKAKDEDLKQELARQEEDAKKVKENEELKRKEEEQQRRRDQDEEERRKSDPRWRELEEFRCFLDREFGAKLGKNSSPSEFSVLFPYTKSYWGPTSAMLGEWIRVERKHRYKQPEITVYVMTMPYFYGQEWRSKSPVVECMDYSELSKFIKNHIENRPRHGRDIVVM